MKLKLLVFFIFLFLMSETNVLKAQTSVCFLNNIDANNTVDAYYLFDGDALDGSGNSNDPTGGAGPAFYSTDAISGQAAYFDGTGGIQYSNSPFMTAAVDELSWGAWIKPDQVAGGGNQIILDEGGSANGLSVYLNNAGEVVFAVKEGTFGSTIRFNFPSDGEYHHIAFTYHGNNNGRMVILLDGIIQGTIEFSNIDVLASHGDPGGIGQQFTASAASGLFPAATFVSYSGLMDEVYYTTSLVAYGNVLQMAQCQGYSPLNGIVCPSPAYMVQNNTSDWLSLNLATGTPSALSSDGVSITVNAIGYNELDGLIYGIVGGSSALYVSVTEITVSGGAFVYNTEYVSVIPEIEGLTLIVGDVYDGKLYVRQGATTTTYVIDVDPASPTYLRLLNTITFPNTSGLADWVFTNDGNLFSVDGSANLIQFDINTATITNLGSTSLPANPYGAIYADDQDYIYAYNNTNGRIYRINTNGPDYTGVEFAQFNSGLSYNDGTRCANAPINLDFGDAPDTSTETLGDGTATGNYRTLLSDNGPRHVINLTNPNLFMGSTVTIESDGNSSVNADGDIDDGVLPTPLSITANTYCINVEAENVTSTDATLYGWIDFDQSGTFDANEFASVNVPAGTASGTSFFICFNVTVQPSLGDTLYSRFRLTTDVLIDDTGTTEDERSFGVATDGEVEDVLITVDDSCNAATSGNLDSDGDGISDICDLDDDNDGITDCEENQLNLNTVSSYFELNGSATQVSGSTIQLTTNSGNQAGQAWSYGRIDFNENFTFTFEAFLGANDVNGADGVAIVFHDDPAGINATGAIGEGLGAQGIQNGILLELDTYTNTSDPGSPSGPDHGQIRQTATFASLTTPNSLPNLENGQWHDIVIDWNATTNTLIYTVNGVTAGALTRDFITNDFNGQNNVIFGFTSSTGLYFNNQSIRFASACDLPLELDTDNDGIPNHLDLDSDNDGCLDAYEGGGPFTESDLVNAGGTVTVGTGSTAINQNLCEDNTCIDGNGVPTIAAGGQTIGDTQDNTVNGCFCVQLPSITTGGQPSMTGVSSIQTTGVPGAWLNNIPNAYLAIESTNSGFVITRVSHVSQTPDPINDAIANPVEGMLVYDIQDQCVKLFNGTIWKCLARSCNE